MGDDAFSGIWILLDCVTAAARLSHFMVSGARAVSIAAIASSSPSQFANLALILGWRGSASGVPAASRICSSHALISAIMSDALLDIRAVRGDKLNLTAQQECADEQ